MDRSSIPHFYAESEGFSWQNGSLGHEARKLPRDNKNLKGPKNIVADALSRLISADDKDFDSTQHLLSLYPEVSMLISRLLPRSGTDQYTDAEGNINLDDAFLASLSKIKDFPEDQYDIHTKPFATEVENILFAAPLAVAPTTKIHLDASTYLQCKQFGTIYKA